MTKAEVTYLMKAGFTLGEIIELDQERGNAAPVTQPEAAPAGADPAGTPEPETSASPETAAESVKKPSPGKAQENPAPALDAAVAAELAQLRQTVKELQAAALSSLRQPNTKEMTVEDIVAAF